MGTVGHAGCVGAGRIRGGGNAWRRNKPPVRIAWRVLPARRWWIVATSVGAAVAWSIGMLPSTFDLRWTAETAVVAGVGGLMLLTSLPLAQYFVLRGHVRRAARWIPINIAAWLLGIAWTLGAFPGGR